MEDETTNPNEQQDNDYIAAINELREKSVPKEQYNKLKEENAKLLKSLINGETIEAPEAPDGPDIAQLRQDLFSGDGQHTNIEYVSKALELRDALIAAGERDPFLPFGHQIKPTAEDIEAANRVAKVMRECIEDADGDSQLFTALLQREIENDTVPPIPKSKKK